MAFVGHGMLEIPGESNVRKVLVSRQALSSLYEAGLLEQFESDSSVPQFAFKTTVDKERQIISLLAVVEPKQRAALRKRFGLPEENSGTARSSSEERSVTSHKSLAEGNADVVPARDKEMEVAKRSEKKRPRSKRDLIQEAYEKQLSSKYKLKQMSVDQLQDLVEKGTSASSSRCEAEGFGGNKKAKTMDKAQLQDSIRTQGIKRVASVQSDLDRSQKQQKLQFAPGPKPAQQSTIDEAERQRLRQERAVEVLKIRVRNGMLGELQKKPLRDVRKIAHGWLGGGKQLAMVDRKAIEALCKPPLEDAFDHLVAHGIISCTTGLAEATEEMQKKFSFLVLGERKTLVWLMTSLPHREETHGDASVVIEQYCLQLLDFFRANGRYPGKAEKRRAADCFARNLANRYKTLKWHTLKIWALQSRSTLQHQFFGHVRKLPCWLAGGGEFGLYVPGAEISDSLELRSVESSMVTSLPDVCWLCGCKYKSAVDLAKHCAAKHGNIGEYRKRVLFIQKKQGYRRLSGEEKRAMIQNTSQLTVGSVPGSGVNDWPVDTLSFQQRQERACAVCACLEFLEDLTRVDLFGAESRFEPRYEDSDSEFSAESDHDILQGTDAVMRVRNVKAVDKLLSVKRYCGRWPLIPAGELFASGIIHPLFPDMVWLLHTRVIKVQSETFGQRSPLSGEHGCAGVADQGGEVWLCRQCSSCLCRSFPIMPPRALCNDMWIGRLPVLFTDLTQSEKWLMSLGRACWRKVLLGQKGVAEDERQIGLIGNSVLLAQPTGGLPCMELPPDPLNLIDTLVIAFTGSNTDNLESAKWATVCRSRYLKAVAFRKQVCPAYQEVEVNEKRAKTELPEEAVPDVLKQCVVCLPEVLEVRQYFPGLAGEEFQSQAPVQGQEKEEEQESGCSDAGAEDKEQNSPKDVSETCIAVNHSQVEDPSSMFAAVQAKVGLLQEEAAKVVENESTARHSHDGQSFKCRDEGGRQVCREIVVDLQSTVQRLGRESKLKVEEAVSQSQSAQAVNSYGLAVPTNEPLSFYKASTWPACFTEFVYGDGVPNLARDRPLLFEEVFCCLVNRQELQYTIPGEGSNFKAPTNNRFASPEMIAIFADVRRRLALLSSARALVTRAGFGKDLQLIAQATSEDFLAALDLTGGRGTVQDAMLHSQTSSALKAVLQNLMVCTANIPGTDGRKMVQRHIGNSMNIVFGPCSLFVTFNFADTRSKLVYKLFVDAGKNPEEFEIDLLQDNPCMPSLRQMHKVVAQSLRTQSKFFLFMLSTHVRHVLGIDDCWWGRHKLAKPTVGGKEDDCCASLRPCLLPFPVACMGPGESQERGFEHAHIKLHGLTTVDAARIKTLLMSCDEKAQPLLQEWSRQGLEYASSLLQESGTSTAEDLGLSLAPLGFSAEQQRQTRFDGGMEEDGQERVYLPTAEIDLDGHMEQEEHLANIESREKRGHLDVPLTGCTNSQLPLYRLPASCGRLVSCSSGAIACENLDGVDCLKPWARKPDGSADVISENGTFMSRVEMLEDARLFSKAFAADVRKCFGFNQMHRCVESCVKYVKNKLSKSEQVKKNRAPLCRAGFFHIVELVLQGPARPVVKRKRRRGKMLRATACIDDDVNSKTFGRTLLRRDHPFISVSSDVQQVLGRCNTDVQFLDLFPVAKTEEHAGSDLLQPKWLRLLGVRRLTRIGQQYAAILAHMFRAMHNCDHYITKYVAKPLQPMKSVIEQMAHAMQRLEADVSMPERDMEKPDMSAVELQAAAKKTLLKIAHAANRCYWQSATELCTIIMTGGDMLQSHVAQTDPWLAHHPTCCFSQRGVKLLVLWQMKTINCSKL